MSTEGTRIVVIGGGTGTFTVLSGLKHYASNLSVIVTMADDGGSSGMLRDEFGVLPPGDTRQCLVALSEESQLMRDLLNYRFESGQLEGHAFGNLLLTALEKVGGNFAEAVKAAEQLLNIQGRVIPVTLDNVRLKLTLNGREINGENQITSTEFTRSDKTRLTLEPTAQLNPEASEAIKAADMIVIGPGNLYSSLIPNLLVEGMSSVLRQSAGKKVFVCNLVNKPGQTDGFQVHDFLDEVEKYIEPGFFDYVVYGNQKPSQKLLDSYAAHGENWVEFNNNAADKRQTSFLGDDLLTATEAKANDPIPSRNLIRHDSHKLALQLMKIYFS